MRGSLAIALVLPVAITACPALLSDWTISESSAVDGSTGAQGNRGGGSGGRRGGNNAGGASDAATNSGGATNTGGSTNTGATTNTGGASSGGTGGGSNLCSPSTCDGNCTPTGCLTTLAMAQNHPLAIGVDSINAYWTNQFVGIVKIAKSGGTPVTLPFGGFPANLAVDGSNVYYTDNKSGGTIGKTSVDGSTSTSIASGLDYPGAIAVRDSYVYFTDENGGNGGAVRRVAVTGGTPTLLAAGYGSPSAIALDATNVYFTTKVGVVGKTPLAGGSQNSLLTDRGDLTNVACIALDATGVYWPQPVDGTVQKIALAGGTPTPLAEGQGDPVCVAVDAANIYFTIRTAGMVMKMPLTGGTPTPVASGQSSPRAIVVDSTSAYWTNEGGTVMKLTPK